MNATDDNAHLFALRVPTPGQLVMVRQRRFVVTGVEAGAIQPDIHAPLRGDGIAHAGTHHLVSLQSVEDDGLGLGDELRVIWELEPGTQLYERAALPDPQSGFDDPRRLDAFLDAVRWGAIASADVHHLNAPFRSGVTIEDYQLDPVARALQMPRVNLLIADDVGLGKTIEAGLTLQELMLRHRARTALIVCPAGLQAQWRDQMRDKFGLEFRIVDSQLMKDLRRRRGLFVNPWTHFPRLITSIDFLKRERPMRLMLEVLPRPGEPAFPRKFDLLILDEAHNVAPSGRGRYALDSLRTKAVAALAPHFEHKLFLTATPHNGYTESFSALLELLDNQRFQRGAPINRKQLAAVMVRRLKRELPPDELGRPRFPVRALDALDVPYTDDERAAHQMLTRYAALRQQGAASQTERFATEFVLKLLKKRLFSSPAAFASTLAKHIDTMERGGGRKQPRTRPVSMGLLRREIALAEEEHDDDDRYQELELEAVTATSRAFRPLTSEERALLQTLLAWAESAARKPDSKARTLLDWLDATLRPGGAWSDERVILFTEYRDTQKWLHELLAARGLTRGGRLLTLYGGMPLADREQIKAAFQAGPEVSDVRILLATDAASEGIDLQNHCARLVHYEIPWNPNRLEQRNGRVDRHGQKHSQVEILHFVGQGYQRDSQLQGSEPGQLDGDLEFLMRAALKVEQIREDLGNVGDVIAAQVEEAMLGKRTSLDARTDTARASEAREMLRFERKLRDELTRLQDTLRQSRQSLRLSPENIAQAVRVGLELAGQPPLEPVTVPARDSAPAIPAFRVPALAGTWATCLDGLAHPHTLEARPIVFDHDLARGRDDVVLCHLEHRLAQMCLSLLRAEVWAPEGRRKLARVSARVLPDRLLDEPAVIAHARLVIIGSDNQRLHEEVITAAGRIHEDTLQRLNVTDTRALIERAAAHADAAPAPASVCDQLARLFPGHEARIRAALDARAKDRRRALEKFLAERADKEAADLTTVLEELRRTILEQLDAAPPTQLDLFSSQERDQLESDRQSLRARADAVPAEIERETAAIRARYQDPTARLFPVALTYLIPQRLARA